MKCNNSSGADPYNQESLELITAVNSGNTNEPRVTFTPGAGEFSQVYVLHFSLACGVNTTFPLQSHTIYQIIILLMQSQAVLSFIVFRRGVSNL